jgi:acyl-CoA synthetase (AMP-forming)/AMP-acid ligase II
MEGRGPFPLASTTSQLLGPFAEQGAPTYWAATDDIPLVETSCAGVLRDAALARPEHLALVEAVEDPAQRRRWTYAQLHAEAEQTARALLTVFKPGEHVAIWGGNCAEWVILQYGLALAGLVMVTVNPAARVNFGEQTSDEMFVGYMNYTEAR